MKKIFFPLLFLSLFTAGCARQQTLISTYLADSLANGQLPAQASYAVIPNQNVPNPILDLRIKRKLEALLSHQDFRLAPETGADYWVTYSYGMEGHKGERSTLMGFPSYYVTGSGDDAVVSTLGYTTVINEPYTEYTSRLRLRVVEAELMRTDKRESVVWVAEAHASGSSPDLRSVLDYLLASCFYYFGKDTGETREIRFLEEDKLLQTSRNATVNPAAAPEAA